MPLATTILLSVPMNLTILEIAHKQNHTELVLVISLSMSSRFTHDVVCKVRPFLIKKDNHPRKKLLDFKLLLTGAISSTLVRMGRNGKMG